MKDIKEYKVYSKLVRDNIPDLIEKSHPDKDFVVTQLPNDKNFEIELMDKMNEELGEYFNAKTKKMKKEELCDTLEVLMALIEYKGFTFTEINDLRLKKRSERGGFEKRLFLVKVEE